jgi:hypothetical protein
MADVKISGLPASTTPLAGTEVLPVVQSGVTKKVASDDLTVKNIRSNATTGILQVAGPAASATRVMTTPDANFTAARTDAGQTFTGVNTFTSPKIITNISDTNGNEIFGITAAASAVNELTIANAATGNNPVLSATGSDTNIGITLTPKGTGNAVLTSGNLAVANGNGIDFSATAGTGTSELLADYEEGTWTPAWSFSTSGSATIGITGATYTKVGRLVTVQCRIFTSAISSPSGNATITGLPFTNAGADIPVAIGPAFRFANDLPNLKGFVTTGATTITLQTQATNSGSGTALTGANFDASTNYNIIAISATYFA